VGSNTWVLALSGVRCAVLAPTLPMFPLNSPWGREGKRRFSYALWNPHEAKLRKGRRSVEKTTWSETGKLQQKAHSPNCRGSCVYFFETGCVSPIKWGELFRGDNSCKAPDSV
jgi:hypothetical protein